MSDINVKIATFIGEAPLYKKLEIPTNFGHLNAFNGLALTFYCKTCNDSRTFNLIAFPEQIRNSHFERWDSSDSNSQHYKGHCNFCRTYTVDFLINTISKLSEDGKSSTLFLRKTGQYPAYDIKPKKVVLDYLDKEDKDIYSKALMCISHGYGIGAYAYFRRIVENETIKMIQDLSNDSAEIKTLYDAFLKNRRMDKLIEEIYPHLPSSLKDIGDNPFKKLYGQLSVGLHSLSEEECKDKSVIMDSILTFVIEKISEEKGAVKDIRDMLKTF